MKMGFYPKLAGMGIYKNRKLYIPYLITCIGVVMMYYIIYFLSRLPVLQNMVGGAAMASILDFGRGVVLVFSVIFLFYTNSFLLRRRKKEFGLYNILGMGKWNLIHIQLWESLITSVIALAGGLLCGILFSKLAEACMVKIMGQNVNDAFFVSQDAAVSAAVWFVCLFTLIFLGSAVQIYVSRPVELLHSENVGERRPKGNWLLAVLGVLILAAAYGIAVSIKEPISALVSFFAAVLLVICGTYLLFIAGSVTICRLLQKNRRYYYKTQHFVSVSSMAYRMKRNGAGLASICILSTMVLVILSSTVSLYVGAEDSLRSRYVRDILIELPAGTDSEEATLKQRVAEVLGEDRKAVKNVMEFHQMGVAGYFSGEKVLTDIRALDEFSLATYESVRYLYFVPLEDYNRVMGTHETLKPDEVIVYAVNDYFTEKKLDIDIYGELKIKKQVDQFKNDGEALVSAVSSVYVFTSEYDALAKKFSALQDSEGNPLVYSSYYYAFDVELSAEEKIALCQELHQELCGPYSGFSPEISVEGLENNRADFYGLFGGLFFLGIFLGLMFLAATVLIMYYKQLTEGYEDQGRFAIMQKVGMTKTEIRKSIHSQMLTVFFLPLLAAGVHLIFAFPLISKLLVLFALRNQTLLILSFCCCYLVFVLFYVIVYDITSHFYYQIVSGSEKM